MRKTASAPSHLSHWTCLPCRGCYFELTSSKTAALHVSRDHTRQAQVDLNLDLDLHQPDLPLPPSTSSPKPRTLPIWSFHSKSRQPILRGFFLDATMSLKREADPFIKPDPDAKRVKTEGGDGSFSLSSTPMAPPPAAFAPSTSSAVTSKIEGGDRKPLGLVSGFCNCTLRYFLKRPLWHAIKSSNCDFLRLTRHFSLVATA